MLLITDRLARHNHKADRLVHELVADVLRQSGHVAAPVQALPQLGALGLQGVRGLLRGQRAALAGSAHEPACVTPPHKR